MIVERTLELGHDTFGQTVLCNDQYRFQVVADRFELFLLLLSERHNQTPGKKADILPEFRLCRVLLIRGNTWPVPRLAIGGPCDFRYSPNMDGLSAVYLCELLLHLARKLLSSFDRSRKQYLLARGFRGA
ncbi:hypothetical protein FQZ97_995670 [compost metagenome]